MKFLLATFAGLMFAMSQVALAIPLDARSVALNKRGEEIVERCLYKREGEGVDVADC